MTEQSPKVAIIGGGLAGCEAALQLAKRQIPVRLYDLKPLTRSAAHHSDTLAEIVCSNSMGNLQPSTASGLLKQELETLDCQLLALAKAHAVPAGNALAVDRDGFSKAVTQAVDASPWITRVAEDVTTLPTDVDVVIIATGPLTSPGLVQTLQSMLNESQLYFFDAAAPIVTRDSINLDVAFFQNRYQKGQDHVEEAAPEGSYINCPLNKEQYEALVTHLNQAERIELKSFEAESAKYFESCLPVEVIASRGADTLRYGPLKPVGILNPHIPEGEANRRPWAVVQLRQDNAEGTLYNLVGFQTNLRWGDQKTMIQLIPGLENAEVVRYGVMHRNTFINSPRVLQPTMQLRDFPRVLVAGQLTGVEGYTESIASGLMASLSAQAVLRGESPDPMPKETMMGALFAYITRPEATGFQPINSNWGILPPLAQKIRDKAQRNTLLAEQAQKALAQWGWSQASFDATLNFTKDGCAKGSPLGTMVFIEKPF